MQTLGAFFSKVLFGNNFLDAKLAVVKTDRNFGFFGHNTLNKVKKSIDRRFGTAENDKLPAVKGVCGYINLKQDAKLMFCVASKVASTLEW